MPHACFSESVVPLCLDPEDEDEDRRSFTIGRMRVDIVDLVCRVFLKGFYGERLVGGFYGVVREVSAG